MKGKITSFSDRAIRFVEEGTEEEVVFGLAEWIKPEYVNKGMAEIKIENGKVSFVSMEEKEKKSAEKGTNKKVKDPYIVNISGKDFMTYEGLLNKAHEKGKFSMKIVEKWVSDDMKRAWCMVRLTAGKQVFDGLGSSTPENTGTMTKTHPVEMAHTRSKGRALRDYLNIGQTMLEELKDGK